MKESLLLSDFLLECRGTIQRMKLRCRTNRSNQNEIFDWIRSLNTEEVNEILLVPNHLFNKCKLQTILTELEVVQRVSMPKSVLFCHGTNGCIRSESTVFPDEFYPFKLFEKELMRHIGFTMKSSNDAGGSLFVDSTLHRDRSKLISILNELSLHCAFSKEPTLGCNDASWFDSLSVFTIGQYIVNIIEVRIWDLWHRRQHLNTTTRNIMNEKPNNNNFLKLELVCSSPEYYSILCRSVQSTLQELLLSKDHQKHLMIAQTSRNRHFPFNASIMKLSHCATKLWFLEYMTENSNSISSFVTVIKFYYGANDDGSSSSRMRKLLCLPLRQVMTPLHEFRAILLERLEVEGNKLLQDQLIAEESMGGDSTHIANTACSTKKKKQKQRKKGKTDKLTNTTITTTEITPTNSVTHVPSTNANAVSSFMRSSELSEEHLIQSKRNIFIGQIIDTIIENTFQVLNSKEHMNEPVTYTTTAEDDITAPVTSSTIETDTDIEPLVLHVAEVEDSPNKSQLESTQLQQEQQQQRSIVGYPPSIYSTDVPWYSIQPPPPQDFQSTLLFTFDPMHPFSSSYAHPLQAYNHFQQYSGNFPDMSVQYNPVSVMPLTDTENESAWEFDLQQLIEEDENESYVSIAKHCESVTSQDSLDVDVEVEGIKVQEQLEKSIQIPSSPKSSVIASIATVPYPPVSPKNSSGHHTEEPVITASHEISCMKESIRELLVHSTFSDCSRTCLLNQMAVYRGVMSNFSAPSAVQSVPSMVFHQPEGMSQYRSRAKSYQIDAAAAAKQSKHGRSGSVSEVQSPNLSMQQIEHRFEAMSDAGDGDHNASSVQKEMPHLTRSHSIGHHLSVKALLPLQPLTMRESSRPTVSHVGTTSIKRRSSLNTAKAVPITATKQVSLSTEMSNNGPTFIEKIPPLIRSLNRPMSDLTTEILLFADKVESIGRSMRRLKLNVVERLRATVKGLWPRAQVKIFGSFMSGLSLPTSDLDMVICLPKVHLEAGPVAPGALEGRNAIKESWQQNLSRCLSSEAWVVADSIKVIGNTAIPVLKVSTQSKYFEGASIALDISFEGPGHRGLEANQMIVSLLTKHVNLRPLVLVLKCFLTRRSLSEAFTGGLSSYSLLLMVVRFLQEVESSSSGMHFHVEETHIDDLGSLLLGFLKFFGEQFDVRQTGISVRRKCYFSRRDNQLQFLQQHHQQHQASFNAPWSDMIDRRHSLQGMRNGVAGPPVYFPFKFDPVFIEDPLEERNNVARNCFRIVQVQRCWTEAAASICNRLRQSATKSVDSDNDNAGVLEALIGSEI